MKGTILSAICSSSLDDVDGRPGWLLATLESSFHWMRSSTVAAMLTVRGLVVANCHGLGAGCHWSLLLL
eukprot:1085363-Prorocentrum_lima.AAC.1